MAGQGVRGASGALFMGAPELSDMRYMGRATKLNGTRIRVA